MTAIEKIIDHESVMLEFGMKLAKRLPPNFILYLQGELGAGKTVLARGILRGFGYQKAIKSPTYTIIEPYELENKIFHMDLYRLSSKEALEELGLRDYFGQGICLIEWAERGEGYLPIPDLRIMITVPNASERILTLNAHSDAGKKCLSLK